MRRKYLGLAIAAMTAFGPASAFGGDREIAEQIMTRLKGNRDSGALKDFTLDMKVDQGIVLFRGTVSETEHKKLVLQAAEGIDGIANVVDEVTVATATTAPATVAKPRPRKVAVDGASLREMLAEDTAIPAGQAPSLEIVPGDVIATAAVELAAPVVNDQQVVAGVVQALGNAQKAGRLKGFGVDVKCGAGVVTLKGRASTEQQRAEIVRITQAVPGVQGVEQMISVANTPLARPVAPSPARQAGVPAKLASTRMSPVQVDQVPSMVPARPVSGPIMGAPVMGSPSMGAPVMGQPAAMSYGGGVGAPRYDAPNLPNYAWPGYAAYPNYAALTYPQQYSPSAWPYIGPFYPYPQVPLGWRKVSLEWDDGWWFLDFTDR